MAVDGVDCKWAKHAEVVHLLKSCGDGGVALSVVTLHSHDSQVGVPPPPGPPCCNGSSTSATCCVGRWSGGPPCCPTRIKRTHGNTSWAGPRARAPPPC